MNYRNQKGEAVMTSPCYLVTQLGFQL